MPSLKELVARHGPVLLIDTASMRIQVGRLDAVTGTSWAHSEEDAGVGLFACVERLGLPPGAAGAFAFCEGPGSILGIRTAAMALRVWQGIADRPVFAYGSLAVVSRALGSPATVIADARRGRWHAYPPGGPLQQVDASGLSGPLVTPEGFRQWTPVPPGTAPVSYALPELFGRVGDADLFRPVATPDALLQAEPQYATWTPQVHQAR